MNKPPESRCSAAARRDASADPVETAVARAADIGSTYGRRAGGGLAPSSLHPNRCERNPATSTRGGKSSLGKRGVYETSARPSAQWHIFGT
jgi:hypothetical protein